MRRIPTGHREGALLAWQTGTIGIVKAPNTQSALPRETRSREAEGRSSVATAARAAPPEQRESPATNPPNDTAPKSPEARPRSLLLRKGLILAAVAAGLTLGGYYSPAVVTALNTVSTDDAYVNGHVTFVAPRVSGQVSQVLVDDNYRVKKGALLVQLDKEPYQVQVDIKKAAVEAAEADLAAAQAQVRGLVAQTRANRFKLEHAIEDVNNQIANSARQRGDARQPEGDPGTGASESHAGREVAAERGHQPGGFRPAAGNGQGRRRRPSIRPCRRSTRPASAWAFPPSLPRATT